MILPDYHYDPKCAAKRQALYCEVYHHPLFAPSTGLCWNCGKNIYTKYEDGSKGYSVDEAGKQHITGCPFCHYSFCE